jgi:hypothetical protein
MSETTERAELGNLFIDSLRTYVVAFPRFALVAILAHVPIMALDAIDLARPPGDDAAALTQLSTALGTLALAITSAYVVPPVMLALGHRAAPTFAQTSKRIGSALVTAWVTNLVVGLGILCFIIPGVVLMLWYCVAIPVSVAEGLGAGAAMERSKTLTDGYRGTALLLSLGYGALLMAIIVVSVIPQMVFEFDAETTGTSVPIGMSIALATVSTAVQALVVAFGSTLFTVFYARLRSIKDGIDVAAIADVFA